IDVRKARQVVERVGESRYELGLRARPRLRALLRHTLAEVVVLGGESEMPILPNLYLGRLRRLRRSGRTGRGPSRRSSRLQRFSRGGIERRSAWGSSLMRRRMRVAFIGH